MDEGEIEVEVEVEVSKGSFVKRVGGQIDLVSPLPAPFNYGALPGTSAPDGDRADAVLLGPRLPAGTRVRSTVRARVRFVDAGVTDDKLICSDQPLTATDRRVVIGFFQLYAHLKGWLNKARGHRDATRYLGFEEPSR